MALKSYSTLYVGALLKKINFEEAADMADTDATHYYQRVKRLTRAVRYETHKKRKHLIEHFLFLAAACQPNPNFSLLPT